MMDKSRNFGFLHKNKILEKRKTTMKKAPQLDANGKRKFGMRDKLAYAAGDLGCNMSFSLKSTVQTFWLVYMTLETGLLSLLLLLVQIWAISVAGIYHNLTPGF